MTEATPEVDASGVDALRLPLLPLNTGVVLPQMVVTLALESAEGRDAADGAIAGDRRILLVPRVGTGYTRIGTVARVNGSRAKCKPGDVIVRVDPRYLRPTEVETLLGDPSKAKAKLGWTPTTTLPELVKEMVEADYTAARRDSMVKLAGFQAYDYNE